MSQAQLMDKETFCSQVLLHQNAMFHTAKSILKNDQDAEDAVQEAICAAFANRGALRDGEKFKPWLLRILANKCYDTCRKRRPAVNLEDVADYLPAAAPDHAEHMALWQAVMALGDDVRATVTLFYYDDLSIKEISGILGISQAAVKTRLSRGRARLRELLRDM